MDDGGFGFWMASGVVEVLLVSLESLGFSLHVTRDPLMTKARLALTLPLLFGCKQARPLSLANLLLRCRHREPKHHNITTPSPFAPNQRSSPPHVAFIPHSSDPSAMSGTPRLSPAASRASPMKSPLRQVQSGAVTKRYKMVTIENLNLESMGFAFMVLQRNGADGPSSCGASAQAEIPIRSARSTTQGAN